MNASVDSKPINSTENKEFQSKPKQVFDTSTLSKTFAVVPKNRYDNNKIVIKDSVLHKKDDTTIC